MTAGSAVILLVEDDAVHAGLVTRVLERVGRPVVVASTLAEGSAALDRHAISLVLLDLFLPDGDGRRWLEALRKDPRHAATPVIVVAGTALIEAKVDCYELGADTMLEKPVPPQVLLAAVNGALQRARPARVSRQTPVAAAPAVPPPRDGQPQLLLAEDDDVVAALVEHRLKREGFEVTRVTDGITALEAAKARPYALAVLDIMMPGLDGFELLSKLRSQPETAALPIVMLTGLGGERDVERALSLGADDYVLKPFSPVELTARVHRLMKKRQS